MPDPKFKLDRRIAEEAALMDRLATLPEDRHPEFLRRLALRGFQQDYAESCATDREGIRPEEDPYAPKASGPSTRQPPVDDEQTSEPLEARSNSQSTVDVSLTSLKDLVG